MNVPDENPNGLGAFEFPVRLPGQYFDKETNLAYNYYRDFDAGVGRYVESDPIGLGGGLNPYSYARLSPVSLSDPAGLYPGQRPPPPPGYDPSRWQHSQDAKGNNWLTDPAGGRWREHPEDEGHWRHWDHIAPGEKEAEQVPENAAKPRPGQKRAPYKGQSASDPNEDAPEWQPPNTEPTKSKIICDTKCMQTWQAVRNAAGVILFWILTYVCAP